MNVKSVFKSNFDKVRVELEWLSSTFNGRAMSAVYSELSLEEKLVVDKILTENGTTLEEVSVSPQSREGEIRRVIGEVIRSLSKLRLKNAGLV